MEGRNTCSDQEYRGKSLQFNQGQLANVAKGGTKFVVSSVLGIFGNLVRIANWNRDGQLEWRRAMEEKTGRSVIKDIFVALDNLTLMPFWGTGYKIKE